jgi:hypothetical protein
MTVRAFSKIGKFGKLAFTPAKRLVASASEIKKWESPDSTGYWQNSGNID